MGSDETRLQELLACHGSDVNAWPREVRLLWYKAQRRPLFAAMIEEEKRFEGFLKNREVPAPSRDFAERIIARSLSRPQVPEGARWFSDLLSEVRPSALAAMLVLGFAIGFGMLAHMPVKHVTFVKVYDDEGAVL